MGGNLERRGSMEREGQSMDRELGERKHGGEETSECYYRSGVFPPLFLIPFFFVVVPHKDSTCVVTCILKSILRLASNRNTKIGELGLMSPCFTRNNCYPMPLSDDVRMRGVKWSHFLSD